MRPIRPSGSDASAHLPDLSRARVQPASLARALYTEPHMTTDATPPTKITYATMSGDRMADLHRELDRAIEQVTADVRQALSADDRRTRGLRGRRVRRSEPDRHADPARYVSAGRARARARRDRGGPGGVSGLERAALARARGAAQKGRRRHSRPPLGAVGADGIRGRQEPARMRRRRRGVGRPHRVLLPCRSSSTTASAPDWAASVPTKRTPACCGRTASGR